MQLHRPMPPMTKVIGLKEHQVMQPLWGGAGWGHPVRAPVVTAEKQRGGFFRESKTGRGEFWNRLGEPEK